MSLYNSCITFFWCWGQDIAYGCKRVDGGADATGEVDMSEADQDPLVTERQPATQAPDAVVAGTNGTLTPGPVVAGSMSTCRAFCAAPSMVGSKQRTYLCVPAL